jgi:parallel beta helix pectate lyase-like protein
MRRSMRKTAFVTLVSASLLVIPAATAQAAPPPKPGNLVVPTQFPTIQSAVDAAPSGATIQVLAGTYREQVRIAKSVSIVGAGMDQSVIKAPAAMTPNRKTKETNIVEITDGASVTMTKLTVAGPGPGTCKKGALNAGIRVRTEAHLELRFAAVRDVHDTPIAPCFHSGDAVQVGDVPGPIATVTVDHSVVTGFQSVGIVVLGFGSTALITHNTITGPGASSGVGTGGIEFPVGSVGTILDNVVSGNQCPTTDPTCGPDWFTQFQLAGIGAGGWGPGTIIRDNLTFDNQVGMLLGESDEISGNRMVDNDFFGLALFDGNFVIDGASISGGGGGVWAIADSSDTNIALHDVTFSGLSGPEVGKVECCGFTATVSTGP